MTSVHEPEPKIEHLTHVLAVCVLRRYFVDNASGRVIRDEDGYTVEEAKAQGLDPILACRVGVDGMPFTSTRFAPLSKGFDLGEFLTLAWKNASLLRGPPKQLLIDEWMLRMMPTLKEDLASLGCVCNTESGRKKVAGNKAALQAMRLYVGNAEEGFSVEEANGWAGSFEGWSMQLGCSGPAVYWYTRQVEQRAWPQGKEIRSAVVRENPVIWAGVQVKVRQERDHAADQAMDDALAAMAAARRSGYFGSSEEDEQLLPELRQGLASLAKVVKAPLEAWQKWFGWNEKAYLFAAVRGSPRTAMLRVAEPIDWLRKIRGDEQKLPERWPSVNEYVWDFVGFGLDLEVWWPYRRYEDGIGVTVAVSMHRNGAYWARDALRSDQSDSIRKAINRGKFKLDWPEAPDNKKKDAWVDLKRAVADEEAMPTELSLHRTFESVGGAHEVIGAMWDALKLLEALMVCCEDEARKRKAAQAG